MDISEIYFDRVKRASIEESIVEPSYKVTTNSAPGDGYMGLHGTMEIIGKNKSLKIFVKAAPIDVDFREDFSLRKLYLNEIKFYKTIYPSFINFEKEKKRTDAFQSIPKCYGVVTAELKETVVLENLTEDGYRMYNRRILMNRDHVEIVLREFGHFHAISFAIKDQNRTLYDELARDIFLHLEYLVEKDDFQRAMRNFIEVCKESLKLVEDAKVYDTFSKFAEEVLPFIRHLKTLAEDESAVVNHGDGWCNNLMFKYDDPKNPGKPTAIRFLDFQMMKVGTPVFDVAHFFYCSTGKSEMDKLEYYQRIYYDSLASNVRALGSDPEILYPFATFLEEWKKYARLAMIIGWIDIKNMLTEPEEAKLAAEKTHRVCETFMFVLKAQELYKERLRDVIVHFVENGFLELLNLT